MKKNEIDVNILIFYFFYEALI